MCRNILLIILSFVSFHSYGQVTYSEDIAPIIFNHCTTCHRPGEIGPMSLTNYDEISAWAPTIKYVTNARIMPPWKADPNYQHYLDENYLSQTQIDKIKDWVDGGTPRGNIAEEPALPNFPQGSLLGTPDLVLSFEKAYKHKGNGQDNYRYFVIPSKLLENKKLKAIEMRPGNTKIVHHALFFADYSGKARAYDLQTPEYGFDPDEFSDFGLFETLNRVQYPGYVPGQKPRYFPDGLAQDMNAGADLIIQMHYAPSVVDEIDSSSVNIFFADETEVITRKVADYIMLPTNLPGGFAGFRILANQVKTFDGSYTAPIDVSLIGIFPHMHMLGKKWEVYIENTDGSKENLIKIDDWDFNWQGGYYFKKFMILKKGAKVKAKAIYENTVDNPTNPNSPPKIVTWGERTQDEMYYLPLLYVPYKAGDENIVFDPEVSTVKDFDPTNVIAKAYPNPVSSTSNVPVSIEFDIKNGGPVDITITDIEGRMVRQLRKQEFFGAGSHIVHWSPQGQLSGNYFIKITNQDGSVVIPVVVD